MAKLKKAAAKRTAKPPRKWPQSADLQPWLKCYLDQCDQHPDVDKAGIKACTPLKQLAECGQASAALARIQRLLGKLPPSECKVAGYLAATGADICLDLPDMRRAEKYLAIAEERLAKAQPGDQRQIQVRLRHVRDTHGLPRPSGTDTSRDDKVLLQLGKYRQAYRTALLAGDNRAAIKALLKITKLIPEIDAFYLQPGLTLSAITAFRRLGNDGALARYLVWLDRNKHSSNLETGCLWGMGLKDLANKRAENLILGHLKTLKRDPDPNIHFPVNDICKELWFFVQTGQKETTRRLLQRVLRELPNWPGVRGGFATSGVLTELAEVLAELDGPEASQELLGLAVQAGKAESHRGFRKGALKAANQQIAAPGLGAAVAQATSIKNTRQRRDVLIPLLTRQAAWRELGTTLDEITDPDELLDALHTVLFKLSGGGRLM